jgi:hypothetical protein
MKQSTTTWTVAAMPQQPTLEENLLKAFSDAKKQYPKAVIAVEHSNALYFFLYEDGKPLQDILRAYRLEEAGGQPAVIVGKDKQNDIACKLENENLFLVVIKLFA